MMCELAPCVLWWQLACAFHVRVFVHIVNIKYVFLLRVFRSFSLFFLIFNILNCFYMP